MPDTPGNFDDDGPVTGKQTISIAATLLRFFRQNAVERSHKCIDFQQRTTRPKSVQSAISLSIKGVLAPEASPFSTELSTGFCGTLLPGDDCRYSCREAYPAEQFGCSGTGTEPHRLRPM